MYRTYVFAFARQVIYYFNRISETDPKVYDIFYKDYISTQKILEAKVLIR